MTGEGTAGGPFGLKKVLFVRKKSEKGVGSKEVRFDCVIGLVLLLSYHACKERCSCAWMCVYSERERERKTMKCHGMVAFPCGLSCSFFERQRFSNVITPILLYSKVNTLMEMWPRGFTRSLNTLVHLCKRTRSFMSVFLYPLQSAHRRSHAMCCQWHHLHSHTSPA